MFGPQRIMMYLSGDWSSDELARVRRMLTSLVERFGYKRIINHTNMALDFLDVDVVNTRHGQGATHFDALQRLSEAVKAAVADFELRNQKNNQRLKQQFMSIARKTTGTDAWLEQLSVRGKLPRWRLEQNGTQMAVWSIDRNGFSFSRAAIDWLHEYNALPVVHLRRRCLAGDVFPRWLNGSMLPSPRRRPSHPSERRSHRFGPGCCPRLE